MPHFKEMIMFWFACICLFMCVCVCVRVSERVHYCSIEGMALLSFSKKVTTTCTLGWAEVKCLCFCLPSSILEYLRLVDCFACGGFDFLQMCCALMASSVSVASSAWLVLCFQRSVPNYFLTKHPRLIGCLWCWWWWCWLVWRRPPQLLL